MKLKLFLSLLLSIGICVSVAFVENPSNIKINSQVFIDKFLEKLKNGENLSSFFKDGWGFVYHQDDRCNGSTDGSTKNLSPENIDEKISIKVLNDGEGWACEKRAPSEFMLDFSLKEKVKDWDRFEIASYSKPSKGEYFIWGGGASDYLKVYIKKINGEKLIMKLEYRSKDPG